MAIRYLDFMDIKLTDLCGGAIPNATIGANMGNPLTARIFYEDTWRDKAKGIITYHYGTAGGSFPTITHGLVQGSVPKGYILVVAISWPTYPTHYTFNNYSPLQTSAFGAFEQQSILEMIYNEAVNDPVLSKFMGAGNKTIFTGTSKGAGQIMLWSQMANTQFRLWSDKVVGLVANAPMGGASGDAGGGNWSQAFRVLRASGNPMVYVNHETLLIWPKGDVTHNVRSFSERLKPLTRLNPKLKPVVYGTDSTYTHTWTYSKPAEFIGLAVNMFDEYLK